MGFRINPPIQQLFGSEVRAKVLGALAGSSEPKTGYEVSKALEIGPPKVYKVLKTLESAGFLASVTNDAGFKRYSLVDNDLREFLRKKVRIAFERDWFGPENLRERNRALEATQRLKIRVPESGTVPKRIADQKEFIRPAEKDRVLVRRKRGTRHREGDSERPKLRGSR